VRAPLVLFSRLSRLLHLAHLLGTIVRPACAALCFILFLPSFLSAAPAAITPERDVVINDTRESPEWKALWDEARELTRQEKYREAAGSYSRLLSLKTNIEEATWEYCLVLIALADWEKASELLEKLLEGDGQRAEYLLSGGLVALKKKEYGRAATYYELLYQKKDTLASEQALDALIGLVAALHGRGKDEAAFPLMEQLLHHRPDDLLLLRQLALQAAKSGQHEKAFLYYQQLVSRDTVEDQVLLEAALVFERAGQEDRAASRLSAGSNETRKVGMNLAYVCWEKYLHRHPDYLEFQEKIANYLLAQGEKEAALPHLLVLLAHDPQQDQRLLQIGALYLSDLGRPDKALSYYEDYLQRHPENQDVAQEISRIQELLAQKLASRVEEDGALPIWRELTQITSNRLAIYGVIAQDLEKRGNSKELREVLGIIHQHEPENREVILRLAELFLEVKEGKQVEHLLGILPQDAQSMPRYLLIRARFEDQGGFLVQALDWYNRYLQVAPHDQVVRLHCLEISAQLGLIGQYQDLYQLVRQDANSEQERTAIDLQYVRVLLDSGLATQAKTVCQKRIADGGDGADGKGKAGDVAEFRLAIAAALNQEGNTFEAEQALRQMLVDGVAVDAVLRRLVEIALEGKEPELAGKWLSLLSEQPGYSHIPVSCENVGKDLSLLRARVQAAAGKTGKAIEGVQEYRAYLIHHCRQDRQAQYQADLALVRLYLQDQQYDKGQELIAEILKDHSGELEPLILEQRFAAGGASGKANEETVNELLSKHTGNKFLSLMQAAEFERKYGAFEAAFNHVQMALEEVPESMSARVFQAKLLQESGNLSAALTGVQALAAEYPGELGFSRRSLEAEFKSASFTHIIDKLAPSLAFVTEGIVGGILAFPDIQHLAVWQKLILARALWADHQWVKAVAVYETLLQPSVDMLFAKRIEEKQITLVLPPPRQTFWNTITFTHPAEPDRLTVVMDPVFVMSQRERPEGQIGTDLYAEYRWQQLATNELSARKALAQGDYYQAMKEYQEVVERNPSPDSLFDLAGIYSRLGLLGKEALLYEEIGRDNPDYPNLAESVQRNSLKRQPLTTLDSGYSSLSGRNGYQDIQQSRGGGSFWMLPTLRQELDMSWSTLHAISEDTDQALWRNRFLTTYSFYPHSNIDFITKVGADRPNDYKPDDAYASSSYDITPLYHLEMRGRIGDELYGFARLKQEVVDDTVQALEQGVRKRDLEGGVKVDLLPRLFCGGEYLFREYSDANHQNRYYVWASYLVHSEPTLLQVTYGQELLHNAEGNMGRDFSYENGFAPGDHPYWSPKEYWQNSISVHFEHQLSADVLGRSAPSYYTLDYSFGYEEGGYDSHTFGGDIFLEMSRHFLVSSSFDMVQGGQVVRKDIALSLVYRW
jgi:tetratricopeptide (TPR) repeat protein